MTWWWCWWWRSGTLTLSVFGRE